ncbi:DUF5052 family protein [Enterococcus faecalis]|uniref:DUF5052 family protein n=1 Tax=Enterococcus faecalis TaxID=1351 RepID=UPI000353095A|nr:DUF5052 family protein [Enterococcus faecalis]EKZ0447646.1 DUF5052 family protein [Enterococcus faecalis]EPH72856.1 hypothetical protein D927_03098 [Enterococcus faecalis 02-MB-BW-10]EPH79890.1 hypothetical protein D924_03006 [Enterococcus faecalis 06-MB-S-10]EPH89701.1 hypothetical protein D923_01563 [Enterococcus faecalis 06-MB-S-04]KXF69437.1 ATPase [Enterococcus faecalis]
MKKKIAMLLTVSVVFILAGCQDLNIFVKGFEQSFSGLEMTINTYDEESQVIDKIIGKSIKIERDSKFDTNSETNNSSVIQVTIGDKELHHVGSSMIVAENGLNNVFEQYATKVDIQNMQHGVPIINSLVNDFKNSFTGKEKLILIRSQNGTPLATYAGSNVSLYSTDVPKSTGLLVDGKYLFVYRCDYTIYDLALLS